MPDFCGSGPVACMSNAQLSGSYFLTLCPHLRRNEFDFPKAIGAQNVTSNSGRNAIRDERDALTNEGDSRCNLVLSD